MIPKQYFNSNKKFKSHKFRKWFLRSGHISLPDSDLGDCEGKVVGVGVTREYLSISGGEGKCHRLEIFM